MASIQATGAAALSGVGLAIAIWSVWPQAAEPRAVTVRRSAVTPTAEPQRTPQPVAPPPAPAAATQPASITVARPQPAAPLDEPTMMSRLRELGDSSPLESLAIAKQANLLFPDSPEAAERQWYVCKSLVNLENFKEAREQAKLMVEQFPGTTWAADVQSHLLVNPPGPPPGAER